MADSKHPQPEDDVSAEDFDLDQIDRGPAAASSMFADWAPPTEKVGEHVSLDDDDLAVEIEDEGLIEEDVPETASEHLPPKPMFGTLSDRPQPPDATVPGPFKPFSEEEVGEAEHEPGAFASLRDRFKGRDASEAPGDEQPESKPPADTRPAAASPPAVTAGVDGTSFQKMGWRDKIRAAREHAEGTAVVDQSPASIARPAEPAASEQTVAEPAETPPTTPSVPAEEPATEAPASEQGSFKRMGWRDKIRAARELAEGGGSDKQTPAPSAQASAPVGPSADTEVQGPPAPESAASESSEPGRSERDFKKMGWRDKIRAARQETEEPEAPPATPAPAVPPGGDGPPGPPEPPTAFAVPGDDDDHSGGKPGGLGQLIAQIREKVAAAKAAHAHADGAEPGPPTFAGVDISPPSRKEQRRARRMSDQMAAGEIPPEFEALLKPVSATELTQLESASKREAPLFDQITRSRRLGVWRQRIGLLVGLLIVALFAVSWGESYITTVLPAAHVPHWLPHGPLGSTTWDDLAHGVLFGLGLLLPLLIVGVIADMVGWLWRGIIFSHLGDVIGAGVAAACALGGLIALGDGNPGVALVLYVIWLVARKLITAISRRLGRG